MNDMENVLNQIIVFSKQDASSLSTTTNNSNSTSTNDNDIDLLGITVTMVRIMKGNNHKVLRLDKHKYTNKSGIIITLPHKYGLEQHYKKQQ